MKDLMDIVPVSSGLVAITDVNIGTRVNMEVNKHTLEQTAIYLIVLQRGKSGHILYTPVCSIIIRIYYCNFGKTQPVAVGSTEGLMRC